MWYITELSPDQVRDMDANEVRCIMLTDFLDSLKRIRRSVPPETLEKYVKWNREYGDITSWESWALIVWPQPNL